MNTAPTDIAFQKQDSHIIVIGNEKGGSGKSTLSMHIIVSLLKSGQRVSSIDLDSRQGSLTQYISNRHRAIEKYDIDLELPTHFSVPRASGSSSITANEAKEFDAFSEAITKAEKNSDFIVIDTPGADTYLNRLAHSMADTLVTPMNDSFVDFDVLGKVDSESYEITSTSVYASIISDSRQQRRMIDGNQIDWIVVRNRLSMLATHNNRNITTGLHSLAQRLGFRIADGISERVIFREFFLNGLTALDTLDKAIGNHRPSLTNVAARQEIRSLLDTLKLPINKTRIERTEAKKVWQKNIRTCLPTNELFEIKKAANFPKHLVS